MRLGWLGLLIFWQVTQIFSHRGDPQRTGVIETAPLETFTGIAWDIQLTHNALSTPLLVEDTLYVGTHGGGILFALDIETGETRWKIENLDGHVTAPIAAGDTLYFGSTTDEFLAVDRHTGETIWTFEGTSDFISAPLLIEDTIYVAGFDGEIYALDAGTGAELWRYQARASRVNWSPVYAEGVLYFAANNVLFALDTTTQEVVWQQSGGVWKQMIVGDGLLYVGNDNGNFYALDTKTGETVWQFEGVAGNHAYFPPGLADGVVYVGNRYVALYAFDALTGEMQWEYPAEDWTISDPIIVGDYLYTGLASREAPDIGEGIFVALDRATGSELWRVPVVGRIYNTPAIHDARIYVVTHAGRVYALE